MFFTGAIIGCLFFGWTSDNFGRYPTLLATNVILGVGGICLPLCGDTYCFTCVRFIMGLTFNSFFIVMQVLGGFDVHTYAAVFRNKVISPLFNTYSFGIHIKREKVSCCLSQSCWNGFSRIFSSLAAEVFWRVEGLPSHTIHHAILCSLIAMVGDEVMKYYCLN